MKNLIVRLAPLFLSLLLVSCAQTQTTQIHRNKTTHITKPVTQRKQSLVVVIDPGHGAFDLGARNQHCEEKDLCLKTGHFLRRQLEQRGYHVIMTRSRDEYIPLKKRAAVANEAKSQVLVSLHFNSAKNTTAQGIEIFYYPKGEPWRMKNSKRLAQTVLSKMVASTEAFSRGVKEGNYCVIRETKMPAILIEGGFMTHKDEMHKIRDDRYLDKLAHSIADGLVQYFEDCK